MNCVCERLYCITACVYHHFIKESWAERTTSMHNKAVEDLARLKLCKFLVLVERHEGIFGLEPV